MVTKVNTQTIIREAQQVAREHPSTIDGLTVMAAAARLGELLKENENLRAEVAELKRVHVNPDPGI